MPSFLLRLLVAVTVVCSLIPSVFAQSSTAETTPENVGMSSSALAHIDTAVNAEITRKQLPGAVVLVGRDGKVVWRKAYGNRALEPMVEPMTLDTVFDVASLTKVVATATSVMVLVERGRVRLNDPVARYIPEFAANGKNSITVEQLLTHRSGLIADNPESDYASGPAKAFENIWNLYPVAEAGARFIYSDVNFIVLGELVRRVSGKPLDEFAAENIFTPLGMSDTGYRPGPSLVGRTAPTEPRDGKMARGIVHDPRAFLLGGVAGHAGLFSTADDLARYCRMILNGGELDGKRILGPLTVARMTEARSTGGNATDGNARGLGWDIATGFSANRGDLFPIGSFGHTGFTGTSIWIDPGSKTFVVFLSNRVHPRLDPKQPADVTPLRGRIATIAAGAIVAPPFPAPVTVSASPSGRSIGTSPTGTVLNGIDVLVRDGFTPLKGRKVGLITNHTGRDLDGRSTIDLLKAAPDVTLVALFSPEHGIRGIKDEKVDNAVDEKTGLPIYSLYGEVREPTADMLKGIDTLVFDIQDIGTRFYTFISTMGLAMEAASKAGIKFVVLDRVNPIGGVEVEGPLAYPDKPSFVAHHPMPVRHGMTVGELALLFKAERKIGVDLTVVKVENWRRDDWFDATGQQWVNPSPNMRSLTEATLYPGIGLLEFTNLSVGRGTDTPFEVVGAPWIDARKLAAALNGTNPPGVRFVPIRYTPKASVFKDQECGGVNIIVTDRRSFSPVFCGLVIAAHLVKLYPKEFEASKIDKLLFNKKILDALIGGAEAGALRQMWERELQEFRAVRRKHLIYESR